MVRYQGITSPSRKANASVKDLSKSLANLVTSLGGEEAGIANVMSNNAAYVAAVRDIWPTESASRLILDHTNAFYVRKDDRPRKGADKDKPRILCEICLDEPLIRSEMDARKEMLSLSLRERGLTFDEIRIIPARRGMRQRHPFRDPDDPS